MATSLKGGKRAYEGRLGSQTRALVLRDAAFVDSSRRGRLRLAHNLHELALAFERARPATLKQGEFVLAADERRQRARAAAPVPLARTMR